MPLKKPRWLLPLSTLSVVGSSGVDFGQ